MFHNDALLFITFYSNTITFLILVSCTPLNSPRIILGGALNNKKVARKEYHH